ncbi:jacalin-related lectin 3-like [Cornus florida]|uniref:jacalin-related lectin 3-like n=1 Tax=Cornus florida TaxID=4283 RepID=UPI00289F7AA8|nr:jacalin-related lectin 3-like [Cornus florida]
MADGQIVTFGTFGRVDAPANQKWDDGAYTMIREFFIQAGSDIYSLQVVYDTEGKAVLGQKRGRGGYLDNGKVVALGKPYAGDCVDSIGVYVKPLPTVITVGPFGTTGGQQWDDGTYTTVRELIIHCGALIDCIQVVYDKEGNRVLGEKHGTIGGQENKVTLDADEFLLSFWGYYGQVGNMVVIRSLEFQSNKKTIGPFGVADGEKFQFPSSTNCAKIIGFHGRSDKYLTAIGAYLNK